MANSVYGGASTVSGWKPWPGQVGGPFQQSDPTTYLPTIMRGAPASSPYPVPAWSVPNWPGANPNVSWRPAPGQMGGPFQQINRDPVYLPTILKGPTVGHDVPYPVAGRPAQPGAQPAQVQQPGVQAPAAVQQLGLGNWYQQFAQQHGGQTVEQYYGQQREGLAEALGDLEWSRGFQGSYGRPPSEDDWKAWYFQSRGGGNYLAQGARQQVRGMTKKQYEKALARAETKEEKRALKVAWTNRQERRDANLAARGAGNDEAPGYGIFPAPPFGVEEGASQVRNPAAQAATPDVQARPPLFLPPQTYWLLK